MICDILEPTTACTIVTDADVRIWTSTWGGALEQSTFQSIVVYGEDNKTFGADITEIYSYFCCNVGESQ